MQYIYVYIKFFRCRFCVTKSGKVHSFGSNEKGQLGRGKLVLRPWEPEQVKGDLEGEKVVKVVTSGSSALAVTGGLPLSRLSTSVLYWIIIVLTVGTFGFQKVEICSAGDATSVVNQTQANLAASIISLSESNFQD
jgi:hypothetical protein